MNAFSKELKNNYQDTQKYIHGAKENAETVIHDLNQDQKSVFGEKKWVWTGTGYLEVRTIPAWRKRFFH